MTAPSDPLVTPDDLSIYLNDQTLNVPRALAIIADVQSLCESIIFPLPPGAAVIVKRVAVAVYASMTSLRQKQMAEAGSPFGGVGMVVLSDRDVLDLRRLGGGASGVLSVSVLPAGYAPVLPIWDNGSFLETGFDGDYGWGV